MTVLATGVSGCESVTAERSPFARPGPWRVHHVTTRRRFRNDLPCAAQEKTKKSPRMMPKPQVAQATSQLEVVFRTLMEIWRKETWFISSVKKRIAHPAYLNIIGLGPPAVPLIIKELRKDPAHWSWALEAITREDPCPNAENMHQLTEAWLEWGKVHGY